MTESISFIAIRHSLESYCLILRLLLNLLSDACGSLSFCFRVFFDLSDAVQILSLLELRLSAEL